MRSDVLSKQRAQDLAGLSELWSETKGDSRVCIALLDGPVDFSHPSLNNQNLTQLESLVPEASIEGPAAHHGTHIASIVFGQPNTPIEGIAPDCRGVIVPIFGDGANDSIAACSQLDLARAINQAHEAGANVINISGGAISASAKANTFLSTAVRNFAENGGLIIAAVGNDGCECLHIPGALPTVLAVGATDSQGVPMKFNNWGGIYQTQGILAPGDNILGAKPGGGTIAQSGTSYATPIVSAVASLLLSLQIKLGESPSPQSVRQMLLESAHACDPQVVADCRPFMVGQLNVDQAHKLVKQQSARTTSNEPMEILGIKNMENTTYENEREGSVLKEGGAAPDFSVKDHLGNHIQLNDFYGKTVILWFYPQANTPG